MIARPHEAGLVDSWRADSPSRSVARARNYPMCENPLTEALTHRDFGEVAMLRRFCPLFLLEVLLMRNPAILGALRQETAHVCDDYAVIAARSGWTPMMFMRRVRL